MGNHEINLLNLRLELEEHCHNCGIANCDESSCLVGFALMCLDYAEKAGVTNISGAHKLLPEQGKITQNLDTTANALARTCLECKNCMDNHSNDCIVAICRQCLEQLQLNRNLVYKGNVLTYLVELAVINPDLAFKTKEAYELKRQSR